MLLLWILSASAAPTVTSTGDGAVTGTVTLPLPPEQVRAKLADPTWLPTVSKDGTKVTVASREGGCVTTDSVSPSAVMTVEFRTRQCPTKDGFQTTLVQSDDFATYAASWTITPTATGTQLTYKIAVSPSLPVPSSIVQSSLRNGVSQLLTNMEAWAKAGGR